MTEIDKPRVLASEEAAALAAQHGLHQMGVRPPLGLYLKKFWGRRAFVWELATMRAYARNQGSYLGQLWSVINPTLSALVYVLIFGILLGTRRGIENIAAFITVGVFTYRFFQQTVLGGTSSVPTNLNLVRSHSFPRAVVPAAAVITEVALFAPTVAVMAVISWLCGFIPGLAPVPISWRWLLVIPAVGLLTLFSTGLAYFMARIGARAPDLANIVPFLLQLVMYASGVMFSITHFVSHSVLAPILEYQPVAVYLYLMRSSLLNEPSTPLDLTMWAFGVGWALLAIVGGFLFFWSAEETYGRD